MKRLIFCLFFLTATYNIAAADNQFGTYITQFEGAEEKWLTLIKPSGSLLSVYIPTLRYEKFPYCTAFAVKSHKKNVKCDVLQVSFDYTTAKACNTGTIGLEVESYDFIAHHKKLDYNTANVVVKQLTELLQWEDASRECEKGHH